MKTKKIPHLKECPTAGTGNHAWLYYAACTLVEADFADTEAEPILRERMKRAPQPTEIADALAAARRIDKPPAQKWSPRDFELINKVAEEPEWSPERPDADTESTLRLLFPGDPLLCCGQSSSSFATGKLSDFRFLSSMSLIVPNAMIAKEGKTQAGHMSAHSLANTGPRQYAVCEADWGSLERQMKSIHHLATNCAPLQLIMVVHSGGKSAHGWWDCRNIPEEQVRLFFDYAVRLGFDPRTWLRSQFVRMPAGTRQETDVRQEILYLDEKTLAERQNLSRLAI